MKKKVANGPNLNRPTAAARHTTSKASRTCITGGTAVGCRNPLCESPAPGGNKSTLEKNPSMGKGNKTR